MAQQISLRWDNHSSILQCFQDFLSAQTLVDVTLVCEGEKLKAHKLVLSACSPLFHTLISDNPCKHPIIILHNMDFLHLKAVIELLYRGKITVLEENLADLIKCAETLQLKALGEIKVLRDKSGNELEIPSCPVPASQSGHESENRSAHQSHIATLSPPKLYDSECSLVVSDKQESSSNESYVTESADFEKISDDDTFILKTADESEVNHPNISQHLDKEEYQNTSDNSTEEQHPVNNPCSLVPTPYLPIVLCEKMYLVPDDDDNDNSSNTPPASLKHHISPKKQQKLKIQSGEQSTKESNNEANIEELGNGKSQTAKQMQNDVVLKKGEDMQKIKRPYIRASKSMRQLLYKIENTQGGRFYGCKICSFTSKYLESLKRHVIAKHQQLKRFKCDQCTYATTLNQHLKRHKMDVHEGLRQYECQFCPYKASMKSGLKRHVLSVHEQKKPFKCEECGFCSSQKANVKKHIRAVHEKIREYTCDFCTFRCAQQGGLKRHIRLVHKKV